MQSDKRPLINKSIGCCKNRMWLTRNRSLKRYVRMRMLMSSLTLKTYWSRVRASISSIMKRFRLSSWSRILQTESLTHTRFMRCKEMQNW